MELTDYQASFRGLLMGDGTDIDIDKLKGLRGFMARDGSVNLPRSDGQSAGKHFLSGKTVDLDIVGFGIAESQALANLEQSIYDAFQVSEDEEYDFEFKLPGFAQQRIKARPTRLGRTVIANTERGAIPLSVQLRASDPRVYSTDETVTDIPLFDASAASGINYPIVNYPKDYPAGFVSEAVVHNAGNTKAFPTLQFYGPTDAGTLTGGTLTNTTNGDVFDHTATITTGQLLTADMTAFVTGSGELVVAIDTSTRYSDWSLPRTPFSLDPGDNLIRYEVAGTTTSAPMKIRVYDTWK